MTTRAKKKLKKEIADLQSELQKYKEFYSSVSCHCAEGVEFFTKSQLFDAIRKECENGSYNKTPTS